MKTHIAFGRAAVGLALALPAVALAQTSGVSHPDQMPIATSPEGIQQPIVYEGAAPALKTRPVEPAVSTVAAPPVVATIAPSEAYVASPAEIAEARASLKVPVTPESPAWRTSYEAPASPDLDAGVVVRIPGPANQLPVGTLMTVKMMQMVSTRSTENGTPFKASLAEAIVRDGQVLLPAGSTLSGVVTDVHGGKRISGAASIHLRTEAVTLPDGTRYALNGQVIDTNLYRETRVDREGTIWRRDHAASTTAAFGLTTGSGAAAGAVFGGVPGALIGAGVGAGVSTAVWLKQDRQTDLPVNTKVTFSLVEPLVVGPR